EENRILSVVHPQPPAFPSCVRIVDPAIEAPMIHTEWERNAQHREALLRRFEYDERIGIGACQDDEILAESQRVELIHPDVIVEIGAPGLPPGSLDLGTGRFPVRELL